MTALGAALATKAQRGDMFQLGRHYLLCGDSTSSEDVRDILRDDKVDMLLTDPPYGADLVEKWESAKRMQGGKEYNARRDGCANDAALTLHEVSDYRLFYAAALRRTPWAHVNTAYVFMSSANLHLLRLACDDAEVHVSDYLIWDKGRIVPGRRDYASRYEAILYGWSGRHAFYGKPSQPNVIDHARPSRNAWHPCQKPLGLVAKLICNGTPPGVAQDSPGSRYLQRCAPTFDGNPAVVYDPFAGGGTTILAAELTGRTCYAMEIDPAQCDKIRERWEQRETELSKLREAAP